MIEIPATIDEPIYVKCVYPSYGDLTTYFKLLAIIKKRVKFAYVDKWTIGFNTFPLESFKDAEDTRVYSLITKEEFENQVKSFTEQFYENPIP